MDYIKEPEKMLPVRYEADVFVAGGSCTGLFAAVRAARLGARVVLVERQNMLGGMATSGLVNVWHSLKDTDYKEQVIAGLTAEMTERLVKCGAAYVKDDPSVGICFDPNRLALELDRLAAENRITVLFHTLCTGVLTDEENRICAAIIENKDGRSAVKAGFFTDATGRRPCEILKAAVLPERLYSTADTLLFPARQNRECRYWPADQGAWKRIRSSG